MARFKDLCLDANDHQALAEWWCGILGYVRHDSEIEWDVLADPEGNEFCVFGEH